MKLYTVLKMMNTEYIAIFVVKYVKSDFIKIISTHNLILIIFIEDND